MNDSHKQIPLDFKNSKNHTFDDFIVESNASAIENLRLFSNSSVYIFYLWGESGCGKSHILNAFINENIESKNSSILIKPKDLKNREYVTLIHMFDYICIDNVEQISNDKLLEEALFFWINEVKQLQKKIILASQISNIDENWKLPDLRSRLASGQTHQVLPLSRHGVLKVFRQQAKQKGIALDEKVINYLEKNCPMNMIFLQELLKQLDKATLIHKKQVTIPLIKDILHTVLVK